MALPLAAIIIIIIIIVYFVADTRNNHNSYIYKQDATQDSTYIVEHNEPIATEHNTRQTRS